MSNIARMMQRATAGAGGAGLDVDEVFSTFLYDGTGSAQTITNGIDLTEGGLVWIKDRDSGSRAHYLFDSENLAAPNYNQYLSSNDLDAIYSASGTGNGLGGAFTSNGFPVQGNHSSSGQGYVSWTFRQAPKFFDVVTWTGDGDASGRAIPHNLGSVPGMIIIKNLTTSANWPVYHRSEGATKYLELDNDSQSNTYNMFHNTTPTSTHFYVSSYFRVNENNSNFVAYLFAHNNNDGEFGPDGDADIIKCGSFTDSGSSSTPTDVNLGFEPQLLLVKASSTSSDWYLIDVMREMSVNDALRLRPNTTNSESNYSVPMFKPTPTGFRFRGDSFGSNATVIYMAIRRGPLAVPEDATKVYKAGLVNGPNTNYTVNSGFPVDLAFRIGRSGTTSHHLLSRIAGGKTQISAATTRSSFNNTVGQIDSNTGIYGGTGQSYNTIHHMFRRSSNFFEAVAYVGNGTATGSSSRTINHPLGVTPEFIIFITDNGSNSSKYVYHSSLSANNPISLNGNYKPFDSRTDFFANPTDTQLNVREILDTNGTTYIAYCFATLAGISKVGSYSGNGSNQTIDCGFTSGARFVLIKRTDSGSNEGDDNSHWYIIDSTRGIVSGNDPYSVINKAYFENTVASASYNSNPEDVLDPASTGFIVNQNTTTDLNKSSATYIFYAVA